MTSQAPFLKHNNRLIKLLKETAPLLLTNSGCGTGNHAMKEEKLSTGYCCTNIFCLNLISLFRMSRI